MFEEWKGFKGDLWKKEINVRDFIQNNYTEYTGDEKFLAEATENSKKLWNKLSEMFKVENEKGIYDAETSEPSQIDNYGPGYIEKEIEKIVGVQTDKPLKRAIFPNGGLRMVKQSLEAYGYTLDETTEKIYTKYRKSHNDGVFSAYTDEIRACRRSGIVTGLPDAYGRGRIIGDYRRVALYGVDKLIEEKKFLLSEKYNKYDMDEELILKREEFSEQIKALNALKNMALSYGFDISKPANNSKEAIQWTYFGYLAAVKEQNGAAMSLGRVSTFLDIYIKRDLDDGIIDEKTAQEYIDHFVMKLRIVRFLRTPSYNELFSGDPTWVTESIGGMGVDGRSLVTKTSFRFLNTLYNLGSAPEPNMTILWSERLPENWKKYCTKVSIDTSALQYENDDLMRPEFGDDYGIACCVSPMKIGKQMQFFGARVNLPKALLYAINGGKDEKTGVQVAPKYEPINSEYLNYEEVKEKLQNMLKWLAGVYVKALNIIHFMHDKYSYEAVQMALHDAEVIRTEAFGIAGLSIIADSLAAIKNAKVKVIRNDVGLAIDYKIEGEYVAFGNNEDETDNIAVETVEYFMNELRKHKMYRNAVPTQSILTITSNVVYGKKTGSTPDGRKAGEPFAPGANPMHGRDKRGAVASLSSVAKLPFEHANDGISYTFAITPSTLGKTDEERQKNLISLLDGYFTPNGGQHLNVNVFNRNLLIDAMEHPENYPQLTIRVSGYAVNFVKLTKEQQLDVINRTIAERI
ncbi:MULTISPECIES: formate C-acetyltransferase [Oceanotoga]|uniref:formate C-acetyltransferase n=1 Tax=Oceanotoga TaxID=1255275 RepID=UPI00264C3C21|nr:MULTISPECIES: formate C-acetyltransferase [Oceanotoga]MDN5341207.1 formate C-acetyltransferase [Oceanotoga sp.]MDO7976888.1 formate C-acetyltransferase [Oceanotoga teriensis]